MNFFTAGPANVEWKTDIMTLKWKPSASDGGAKITEYIVERREVGKKSWKKVGSSKDSKTTFLEIRGLKKNCSFNFRISAKNQIGLSQPLVLEETVKGKSEVKAAVAKSLPGSPNVEVIILGVSPSLKSRYCEGYRFWST